ncbi:MAG: DUF6634 family protein [Roseobacter sp.]
MDHNDDDIAWILELQASAPLDSKSWFELGYIKSDAIGPELTNLFQELSVSFKEAERNGQPVISAGEWTGACRVATAKLFKRMHLRSLELAVAGPEPAVLATAPRLEKWTTVRDPGGVNCALIGYVSDHPLLSNRWLRTSRLCGLDLEQDWARTNSRWYKLGKCATPEHLVQILGNRGKGLLGAALPVREAISRTEWAQVQEGFRDDHS